MTAAGTDRTVRGDGVALGTTDFGVVGGGSPEDAPALVLMHGLGDTRAGVRALAGRLHGWRVVTMDLRGHGASETAPWSFDAAAADLDAVVAAYGLERPWVGGHSLGGMVALHHLRSGRVVAGAVNVDGWGPGIAERYVGADASRVQQVLDEVASGRLPTWAARWASGRSRQAREGLTRQVLAALHDLDVVAWHRDAPGPTLAVNATAAPGRTVRLVMGAEHARLSAAHREGLRRDLARASEQQPLMRVLEIDATHSVQRTHPDEVAAAVRSLAASPA